MVIIGYGFIGLGAIDYLLSLIGVDLTGFSSSPVVFGVVGGILLFLVHISNSHKDKVAAVESLFNEGEALLKSGIGSVKEGKGKQENGSLFLTNIRLFYSGINKGDAKNFDTGEEVGNNDFEFLLGDIASVETKFPNYLIIKDKSNNEFKFIPIPFTGNKWKTEILKAAAVKK